MTFTQDWFSVNVGNWTNWLARFKDKPVKFLEIGCFEGRATTWLLENILSHPDATITCVDPFIVDDPATLNRFKENIKLWENKVRLLTERSQIVVPKLTGPFDFVYVDGSHLSTDVYLDGINGWLLTRLGGLLVFDDYFFDLPGWDDWKKTRHGIEKALAEMTGYEVIHKGHQVALLKRFK